MSYSSLSLEQRVEQLRAILPRTASHRITGRATYRSCPQCGCVLVIEEIYGPRIEEQWLKCPHCQATLGLTHAYEAEVRVDLSPGRDDDSPAAA